MSVEIMQSLDICMFYLRGACRFGIKCWNSHDLTSRSPKTQELTAAATAAYYEQGNSMSPSISADTSDKAGASTSTSTKEVTSTTASTSTNGKSTQVQAQGLQLLLEASMKPILKQSGEIDMEIEKVATELSVAMKTGNGKGVKETASKLHALHQKKKKESIENENSAWNDIRCAIDSDLQCNICFELFIKPTVLNCSHTFCESCIHIWSKRNKKCPICRVHIRSKSFCLTLDTFIEKVVEQLPNEIKHKRNVAIKDRKNKMKLEKSQPIRGIDLIDLMNLDGFMDDTPLQFLAMDENDDDDDIDEDVIVEESEMFRMNLHDTVVNTGGVNPLLSYIADSEEQPTNGSITRPRNSSARH